MMVPDMDAAPNCAICNAPAYPECPCEAERLQVAVKQAEQRAMDERMGDIRNWVINNARQHILAAFERLNGIRKHAHAAYLASLPNYDVFMRYSGHPPIHPMYIAQLQTQIAEAQADLKRGSDADWRTSVLRYPEILDYFYSLVELKLPDPRSPRVMQPPFAIAGYADRGYMNPTLVTVEKKKKKRRDREGSSAPPPEMHTAVTRLMMPPPVPTPPNEYGGYPPPPPGQYPY